LRANPENNVFETESAGLAVVDDFSDCDRYMARSQNLFTAATRGNELSPVGDILLPRRICCNSAATIGNPSCRRQPIHAKNHAMPSWNRFYTGRDLRNPKPELGRRDARVFVDHIAFFV